MAHSVDVLAKKLEEIKIANSIFFGKDLSYEQNFLNVIIEKLGEELKDCKVSSYFLVVVNRLLDEHFFEGNGLVQLGWCLAEGFSPILKMKVQLEKLKFLNFIGSIILPIDLTNSGTYCYFLNVK